MSKKYTWKVWLRPNMMTKDVHNDFIADVSTAGNTKSNQDIAEAIKKEGSELQIETLIDVINRVDRWKRRFLLEGSSVQDSNVHLAPRVADSWEGAAPHYDPKEHKRTIDAIPTASLRKALEDDVEIEVLGKKTDGGAIIGLVTDTCTGKTDGTITCSENIIITGRKIKIVPADEAAPGIFLAAADGTETPVTSIAINNPKRIICRVPELAAGSYTLKIVTRFSNGSTLLRAPRTLIYEIPLTVAS
jgi:hypothetical protein